MPNSRLIFFPASPEQLVDYNNLLSALSTFAFINPEADKNNEYLPGDKFLNLLTFLGCSPNINLTPTDGESHCFISLLEATEQPGCLGYTQTVNPKCPNCTKRISNWKTDSWMQGNSVCCCDKCQTESSYAELNWKQECGFACCGFEIAHIYPHEAVPTDQLLTQLEKHTSVKWSYCYANN